MKQEFFAPRQTCGSRTMGHNSQNKSFAQIWRFTNLPMERCNPRWYLFFCLFSRMKYRLILTITAEGFLKHTLGMATSSTMEGAGMLSTLCLLILISLNEVVLLNDLVELKRVTNSSAQNSNIFGVAEKYGSNLKDYLSKHVRSNSA